MTDLKAIQERAEKATPEPWETHQEGDGFNSVRVCKPISSGECLPVAEAEILGTVRAQAEANAEFIAHAREDIPKLLKALAEARGKLEAVREQAAYGFTGETLKNMTEGMSAQEMNGWWMKRLDAILGGSDE